jgi:hypothetical protein
MRRKTTRRDIAIGAALIFASSMVFAAISRYHGGFAAAPSPDPAASCPNCAAGTAQTTLTLNPKSFVGPVRDAYQVAHDNPALLAQLHCYCGCDRNEGHKNLLDCFRDKHGSTCEICVGEAIDGNRMFNQGAPVEQIRDALRARYDHRG